MRITREEAAEIARKANAGRPTFATGNPLIGNGILEQAVVATKLLTQSPEWNVFLQRVQAFIDQERKTLVAMGDAIALPNLASEQVLQAQRHMAVAKARIEAWEQVQRLPVEIIEMATAPNEPKQ